jgi:hypothetical protein
MPVPKCEKERGWEDLRQRGHYKQCETLCQAINTLWKTPARGLRGGPNTEEAFEGKRVGWVGVGCRGRARGGWHLPTGETSVSLSSYLSFFLPATGLRGWDQKLILSMVVGLDKHLMN